MKTYYMQDAMGFVFTSEKPQFHPEDTILTPKAGKAALRAQSIETVKGFLEGVNTVYGIVQHVSSSGMSRDIDLYIIKDNRLQYLTGYVSNILGYPMSKNRGMRVSGCGMDMVFHCVSSLAEACGIDYKNLRSEIL